MSTDEIDVIDSINVITYDNQVIAKLVDNIPASILERFKILAEGREAPDTEWLNDRIEELEEEIKERNRNLEKMP